VNLVFAGTPDFAVPSLRALLAADHRILAVYTQPDRPAGRGRQVVRSPVKMLAEQHGLAVHQPLSLKQEAPVLQALAPDAMIVVAYGLLLPRDVLAIPARGCINVHASLLPRWRGAAPIQRAIEAGDAATGITIMQMSAGLDTGDILLQAQTPITEDDTAQTLHDRLALLGAETLVRALAQLGEGRLPPRAQDEAGASYAAKLSKVEAGLDWGQSAAVLARKIRALNPWPVAQTRHGGRVVRVWMAHPLPETGTHHRPGTILATTGGGIDVQTADGVLRLTRVQTEGGRPLDARDFLNGYRLTPGDVLEG
jgi:methionyl-tRNA formyltransferase